MRVLVQRVSRAQVSVAGEVIGRIGTGLLVFAAIGRGDGERELAWMADKVAGLRVFPDAEGRMNVAARDAGGTALVISQFTLYGDCARGKRPSFTAAAEPAAAERHMERFIECLRAAGLREIATGRFGADMSVELVNEGPVTIWLEREPAAGLPS